MCFLKRSTLHVFGGEPAEQWGSRAGGGRQKGRVELIQNPLWGNLQTCAPGGVSALHAPSRFLFSPFGDANHWPRRMWNWGTDNTQGCSHMVGEKNHATLVKCRTDSLSSEKNELKIGTGSSVCLDPPFI